MPRTSTIPRLHAFEFHDQRWFPHVFRSALTEWLRAIWEYSQAAQVIAPILAAAVRESKAQRIIDLCSGGTGPMIPVARNLQSLGVHVPILATDKFPDPVVMARLEARTGGNIRGSLESLDATALPKSMTGFRTMWNSFHHFRPAQAREILRDACVNRQPIAMFEFTERTVLKVLLCFPATFLSVYWCFGAMSPPRWEWWFFTWILPVIPLTIAWDGFVSHLRAYTPAELSSLTESLQRENYHWSTGRVPTPQGGLEIMYLIGLPVN